MLVGASPRRVAIVGGARIPFARGNGAYAQVGNQEMLTAALRGVVDRFGLQGQRVDDVAAGAVMKHSSQWNLTRESVLGCGLAFGNTRARSAARLRDQPRSGDPVGQQDRTRPDRLRNCRRCRHGERPARGVPPELSTTPVAQLSRQEPPQRESCPGSACARRISGRCCRESRNPGPACRWAKARNSWSKPGGSPVQSRISWPWKVIKRPQPLTLRGFTRIWSSIISDSRKTTTFAPTPPWKNWRSSSRHSICQAPAR